MPKELRIKETGPRELGSLDGFLGDSHHLVGVGIFVKYCIISQCWYLWLVMESLVNR